MIKLKRNSIILLVFLFSLFTPFTQITQVSGITFTYTPYWFYIDQQGVIDYEDMSFTVQNKLSEPVEIVCTFKEIEGVNIDVIFDWTRINIPAKETVINHYKINVIGEYSTIFNLEINLEERLEGSSDSQLIGAGTIINKVAFYSDSKGSLLDLKIANQADTPREASVLILYSHNDSMPYSPIKEFNGSSFYGVLPYGDYMVKAYDIDSNIYAEEKFVLNTTEHNVTVNLALVGFGKFKLSLVGVIGIEATIFNHVGEIEEVEIYGELYLKDNNQLVETSKSWTISPLPKTTNQELTLWFEYNSWIPKEKYVVRGVIVAGGVPIAYRLSDDFDIKSSGGGVAPLRLETVLLVGVVVAFVGYFIYIQRGKQKIKVLLNEKH